MFIVAVCHLGDLDWQLIEAFHSQVLQKHPLLSAHCEYNFWGDEPTSHTIAVSVQPDLGIDRQLAEPVKNAHELLESGPKAFSAQLLMHLLY